MSSPLQDSADRLSPTLQEMLNQARRENNRAHSQPAHQPPQVPQLSQGQIEENHNIEMKHADLMLKLMMMTSSIGSYRNDENGIPGFREG